MSSPFGENISTKEVGRFARRLVRHQYYCKEGASAEPRRQVVENKGGKPARAGVAAMAAVVPYRFCDGWDAICTAAPRRFSHQFRRAASFFVTPQHVAAT
jgi:hypothetical protein